MKSAWSPPSSFIDQNARHVLSREDDWQIFKVNQQLDFCLVGIIHQLTASLAVRKISTFVLSTFKTDYILVKKKRIEEAIHAFQSIGCHVTSSAYLPEINAQ